MVGEFFFSKLIARVQLQVVMTSICIYEYQVDNNNLKFQIHFRKLT
jgi:hypothetical protein